MTIKHVLKGAAYYGSCIIVGTAIALGLIAAIETPGPARTAADRCARGYVMAYSHDGRPACLQGHIAPHGGW